jgi:hypothetical protein
VNIDQRRHPRLECDGIADVQLLGSPVHGSARILDLSIEGCLVELEAPLELAMGVVVEITFTVNQLPFRVRAEVRAPRSEKSLGFRFPLLSARSQAQIQDLVEELGEDRSRRKSNLRVTAADPSAHRDDSQASLSVSGRNIWWAD